MSQEEPLTDPDPALVERFRTGEREAFQRVVERYAPRLYNVLAHMTADRAAAEDLLQDALLCAYNAIERFRGESGVYTWLYRIAVNKALNWIRKTRGKITWESLDAPISTGDGEVRREIADFSENPESRSEQGEMVAVIHAAIATLGEANRIVFTLREIEGMEYDDIARTLGCTQEAVRTRLHRAKKELKEKLRPYLENREMVSP